MSDIPAHLHGLEGLLGDIAQMMYQRGFKYGPNNIAEFGETGLMVRLGDKYQRLKNSRSIDFEDESVDQTLDDVIGYALIWKLWRAGLWPGSPYAKQDNEPPF